MCPSLLISAIFILVGLILCFLEVLVLPGFISGLIGFCLVVYSIIRAYTICGAVGGTVMLVGTVLLSALMVWLISKSGKWKKLTLNAEVDSKVNVLATHDVKPGAEVVTFSRLAPIGKVKVDDKIHDAKSIGPFIDPGKAVKVVEVTEQYLIVEPI